MALLGGLKGLLALMAAFASAWAAFQARQNAKQGQFDQDSVKAGQDAKAASTEAQADEALKEFDSLNNRS